MQYSMDHTNLACSAVVSSSDIEAQIRYQLNWTMESKNPTTKRIYIYIFIFINKIHSELRKRRKNIPIARSHLQSCACKKNIAYYPGAFRSPFPSWLCMHVEWSRGCELWCRSHACAPFADLLAWALLSLQSRVCGAIWKAKRLKNVGKCKQNFLGGIFQKATIIRFLHRGGILRKFFT